MSASAAPEGVRPTVRRRTWLDRAVDASPLIGVYFMLVTLLAWQSRWQRTPWLFSDELEYSELARSIAATGHAALRGEARPFTTLWAYVNAPAWLFSDIHTAYAAAKYLDVCLMAAVVFPVYLLARLAVGQLPALFAAAASGAIPAMTYSAYMVEEPLAYPYSALCLYLTARMLVRRDRRSVVLALAAALIAPLIRDQLIVIPATIAACGLVLIWQSGSIRRWRERWGAWDWVGAVVLVLGAIVVFNRLMDSFGGEPWSRSTGHYKGRIFEYGGWALGAFVIGVGVVPFMLGLASLVSRTRDERTDGERAVALVALTAVPIFWFYSAVKAAYLSTAFATRVEERNLIYLAPLVFALFAIFLARPRVRSLPLALMAVLTLVLVLKTPYQMGFDFYWDAPGLSILQGANRELAWTPETAQWVLIGLLALALAVALAVRALPRYAAVPLLAVLSLAVLAWTVTGEIAAAAGTGRHAEAPYKNLPKPLDWVDRASGGKPVIYLGQGLSDTDAQRGVYFTEFWNKSIKKVWSLDGTAPGPGATLTPNHDALGRLVDGEWKPVAPGYSYVLTDGPIDLVGTPVARRVGRIGQSQNTRRLVLWKIIPPLRVQHEALNLEQDGWIKEVGGKFEATYAQFATPGQSRVNAVITVSRRAWHGPARPSKIVIEVGTLVIGPDKQPALGKVTAIRRWTIRSGQERKFVIPAPPAPFRVVVRAWPYFIPAELDPAFSYERRKLTAMVGFRIAPVNAAVSQRQAAQR